MLKLIATAFIERIFSEPSRMKSAWMEARVQRRELVYSHGTASDAIGSLVTCREQDREHLPFRVQEPLLAHSNGPDNAALASLASVFRPRAAPLTVPARLALRMYWRHYSDDSLSTLPGCKGVVTSDAGMTRRTWLSLGSHCTDDFKFKLTRTLPPRPSSDDSSWQYPV